MEARYDSLHRKFVELKGQEARLSSDVLDWRNACSRAVDEAEQLRTRLAVVEAERDKAEDQRMKFVVMLAKSMIGIRSGAEKLKALTEAAQAVADTVDPPEEGVEARPLIERD
uniref:Uncharacterized protein n=1 Tax=Setaria viridis TaxID=4556 RepID=A0A4U6SQB6_SETVI|nr:hypothetical protein SEVIR_9G045401v2 [Setaria viridis]